VSTKRHDSGELPTVAVPRDELAPASASSIECAIHAFMRDTNQDDRETLVPCPRCAACPGCHGEHMVTAERAGGMVDAGGIVVGTLVMGPPLTCTLHLDNLDEPGDDEP
jgi:hypothetical protein